MDELIAWYGVALVVDDGLAHLRDRETESYCTHCPQTGFSIESLAERICYLRLHVLSSVMFSLF